MPGRSFSCSCAFALVTACNRLAESRIEDVQASCSGTSDTLDFMVGAVNPGYLASSSSCHHQAEWLENADKRGLSAVIEVSPMRHFADHAH